MSRYCIRFFSNYSTSAKLKIEFERENDTYNMSNYGKDDEIWITDGDDYSHVIIINTTFEEIADRIPTSNIVGLAFEPNEYIWWTRNISPRIGKYCIGTITDELRGRSNIFVEQYAYMPHHSIHSHLPIPAKSKFMSIIFSNKTDQLDKVFGYRYRVLPVNAILHRDWPIDIYGHGCKTLTDKQKEDPRIKGAFQHNEPYDDYQFHICIENNRSNAYISEKLTQPLVRGCTPIYLGARNVLNYVSDVILLTGVLHEDLILMKNIMKDPDQYKKVIDVEGVKNKTYLLRNLDTIFA